jgi:HSP20 family protein
MNPYEFLTANPFTLMRRMSEEMDRAFGPMAESGGSRSGTWYPAIDITENNGQLQVHAELPGIKPEDVHVEINNDILTIQGERKSEHQHQIGRAYRSERRYGEFYREIALPEGVNADQVKASFNHGVLEISIPVPQQTSNRRQIPISTSSGIGSSSTSSATSTGSGGATGSAESSGSGNTNAAQAATAGSTGSATRSATSGGSR